MRAASAQDGFDEPANGGKGPGDSVARLHALVVGPVNSLAAAHPRKGPEDSVARLLRRPLESPSVARRGPTALLSL